MSSMANSTNSGSPQSSTNTESSVTIVTTASSASRGKMVQDDDAKGLRRLSSAKSVTFAEPAHEAHSVSGLRDQARSPNLHHTRGIGFTTDTDITRCLEISSLELGNIYQILTNPAVKVEAIMQKVGNVTVLYLDDTRATEALRLKVQQAFPDSECTFVHPQTVAAVLDATKLPLAMSIYNGQLVVTSTWVGHDEQPNYREMFEKCYDMVQSYGPVRCFSLLAYAEHQAHFRVEMYSLAAVDHLLKSTGVGCQHFLPPHVNIIVAFYHHNGSCTNPPCDAGPINIAAPTLTQHSKDIAHSVMSHGAPGFRVRGSNQSAYSLPYSHGRPASLESIPETSVTEDDQSLIHFQPRIPFDKDGMLQDLQDYPPGRGSGMRSTFPSSGRRGRRQLGDSSHPGQSVDIAAIENGLDVRTTLMLRNLPNRLSYFDVLNMLYRTSKGAVDFLYVRIDFGSGLNVGYGFVNFISPEHIVPFLKASVGKPWSGYDSHKVLEVSYATIQGQECLIQKFRNSSVLRECEAYTPKIYYTIADNIPEGKQVGDDYPFPPPDNLQKLNRSLDNARTIGLYSTKDSRSNRDARRPRSQFDRGTPRAVHDEAVAAARSGGRGRGHDAVGIIGSATTVQRYGYPETMSRRCDYGPIGPPQHRTLDPSVPSFSPDPYAVYYHPPGPPSSTISGPTRARASNDGAQTGQGSFPSAHNSRTHYKW